ncbi:MAG: hypothetical protein J0I40_02245 [Cellulomonas sp.]|nr:hypothetical protein [Cellulomonas sp.]
MSGVHPRTLRATPAMRRLVAQTRIHPAQLVLPMFVREGITSPVPIASMPGVVQHRELACPPGIGVGEGQSVVVSVCSHREGKGQENECG